MDDLEMEEIRRRREEDHISKWRIKREVSIGDLLAISSALFTILYAYSTLDKRLTVIEAIQVSQKERDSNQDESARNTRERIERALVRISDDITWIIKTTPSNTERRK